MHPRHLYDSTMRTVGSFDADAWFGVILLLAALLLELQLQMVAARLTSGAGAWAPRLVPLWILFAVAALALAWQLLCGQREDALHSNADADEARDRKILALLGLVELAMLFASLVMLVGRLDGHEQHTFHAIAAPLYAGMGVLALYGAAKIYVSSTSSSDGYLGA